MNYVNRQKHKTRLLEYTSEEFSTIDKQIGCKLKKTISKRSHDLPLIIIKNQRPVKDIFLRFPCAVPGKKIKNHLI